MPRKTYTERFKRDAVALYESTPGATVKGPNPGKWTRGFHQDAIVSVANQAASKAFGER